MFCGKCGKPVDAENDFCIYCGARIQKITEKLQETPVDTQDQGMSDFTQSADATTKKKHNVLIWVGTAIAVLAAIIILCFRFGAIKNWVVRSVSKPEELLLGAYSDSIQEVLGSVLDRYAQYFEQVPGDDLCSIGELQFLPTQQFMELLSADLYPETTQGNISWLSALSLSWNTAAKDMLTKNVLSLALNDCTVLSVEQICDVQTGQQWLTIPELSSQALVYTSDTSAGLPNVDMAQLYSSLPSRQLVEGIVFRYLDIVAEGICSVEKQTVSCSAGQLQQDLTELKTYFDEISILDLSIKILEQAKTDAELQAVVEGMTGWYNAVMKQSGSSYDSYYGTEYTQQELYSQFVVKIDEILTELQQQLSETKNENYIYLYSYLDSDNRLVGQKLVVSGAADSFSHLTLKENDRYEAVLSYGTLEISGSGTVGESRNGSFTVKTAQNKLFDFEIKDFREENGVSSGIVQIKPTAYLFKELEMDASEMADVLLQIYVETSPAESKMEVRLLSGDSELLSMNLFGTLTESDEIVLPDNGIDIDDENAMGNWAQSLTFAEFLEMLHDAGMPIESLTKLLLSEIQG